MADRISSLDSGYETGDLSLFPEAIDDKDMLYQATNNASVVLKQTLTYTGTSIIVEDTSGFPATGLLRIGPPPGQAGEYEMVYYGKKTGISFQQLKRGFFGSRRNHWVAKTNFVSNSVASEHHNAIKDAIYNMERNFGTKENPDPETLNWILKNQETRFLAPKALFRAFPISGVPPLKVRFQNFSTGYTARFMWDFGDGATSVEEHPIHTYVQEGEYTVKLNVVTALGGQGVATKNGYITVNSDESTPFFYVESIDEPYSVQTASEQNKTPKTFVFVDQTDGDIVQRNWYFGDEESHTEQNPDIHYVSHMYDEPGEYTITQLIQFANGRLTRVGLSDPLVVL